MLISPDELDPFQTLALIDLSYSRLDTLESCGAKFWFSYIQKEPRTFAAAATLGNIVHAALQHTDFDNLNLEDLLALYWLYNTELNPDNLISQELLDAGVEMLGEFVDRHSGEKFNIIEVEQYFELVLGTALFRGYIDRIDLLPDGGVHCIDYKSGKFEVAQKNIHSNLQLVLYALVIEKLYPDLWPITGELYYLRSGKRKSHTFTREELREGERNLASKVYEFVTKNNFEYTSNTRTCMYLCDFGKNGTCKRGYSVLKQAGRL